MCRGSCQAWLALQGIEEKFLEEWHQKLHTNTTPEDINICEAYLGCLHSGNPDDFWRLLWENGGITREQLATMDRPVTGVQRSLSSAPFWQLLLSQMQSDPFLPDTR